MAQHRLKLGADEKAAEVAKLLASPARLAALRALRAKPMTVAELQSVVGLGAQRETVWKHMDRLRKAGLVRLDHNPDAPRDARFKYTRVVDSILFEP